jgi:serine protease
LIGDGTIKTTRHAAGTRVIWRVCIDIRRGRLALANASDESGAFVSQYSYHCTVKPLQVAFCLLGLLPLMAQSAAPSSDRLIVKWRSTAATTAAASDERVHGLANRIGQQIMHRRNIGGRMSVVQLGSAQQGTTLAATLQALRTDPDIEFVEPDHWMKAQPYTPNDPLFSDGITHGDATHPAQFYESQWYVKSAQPAAIRADSAWDITRGGASTAASIVVAVIDTGIRLDHPDLAGKLLPGYDFVSIPAIANDGNGWDADPSDPGDFISAADLTIAPFKDEDCDLSNSSWHGTRVAGLIGASTDNGVGMAGAGFNVRIVPARALGKCGGHASDVIAAMYWAAGMAVPPPLLASTSLPINANPAQILNLSLGSEAACSAAYGTAVADITAHGVLVVASAGNEGAAVGSPASCPGALAVAGLRHVGTKVGYSNLGPEVSIAAPAGNCVFVLLPTDPCVYALNTTTNLGLQEPAANAYSTPVQQPTFGTSFSAPLVASTAGLMKATNPALTPALLIARIKESARTFPTTSADATTPPPACALPSAAPLQAAECICNTQVCGAGMLDAAAAVAAAQRPAVLASVSGLVSGARRITLNGSRSAAATGRTISSYLWSVDSVSGGATTPTINSPNAAIASASAPTTGSYVLRLTVADNMGGSDFALVTVTPAGGSSNSPPPESNSGGGDFPLLLLALAALLLIRQLRRTPACELH